MKLKSKQAEPAGRETWAFTLVELLVVISIIGVVAALVVGGVRAASGKRDEAAVKAKLAKLVLAIEAYKGKNGFYPPDNPANALAFPYWNPLAYELSGVRVSGANFIPEADPTHTITPAILTGYFSLTGLANTGKNTATKPRYSLSLVGGPGKNADFVFLTNGTPGLPAAMLLQVPAEHPAGGAANVWRYRAYPAGGHNPKSFDLWAEYKRSGGGTNILGNWR
ncbi:MAG: type II secretion system protein [Limisphaerales bacterium]